MESPAKWLNRETEHQMMVTTHKNWRGDVFGAHLIIAEMFASPTAVDQMHGAGAKVIYEADDAVVDTYGKERKQLTHLTDEYRQKSIETVKKCDAMTVTTETLKKNWGRFFKGPIYVLPNYMDFEWWGEWNENKPERVGDEVRIGWAGSRSHHEDLRQILVPALLKVLKKYPQAKFVYCGYGGFSSDKKVTEIGWGEDIFKEIPRTRREFVIPVPTEVWPVKSRTLDFDIGVAPLIGDYFNACKSNIKWQEYSANKVPGVYSPLLYGKVVKHGVTGFIAKDTHEWVKHLSRLVESALLRKEVGETAYKEVKKNWNIANHFRDWEQVYKEVLVR